MASISSMRSYTVAQQAQQQVYSFAQNARVATEATRSANVSMQEMAMAPMMMSAQGGALGGAHVGALGGPYVSGLHQGAMEEVPRPEKCIGQVVLDWEFIHDLDLHLLRVQQSTASCPNIAEPSPEPNPETSIDLHALVVTDAAGQRLRKDVSLQSVVSYRSKVHNPSGGETPEAVLQVDRNAAVHALKPVENLYLTETLQPGAYVLGVHNYSLRKLADNTIGSSSSHKYRTFDDFKKMDPGYQKMEKALHEQELHAGDLDGTPEKQAIMAQVDQDMNQGSSMMQTLCTSESPGYGVHYGVTVWSYPEHWTTDAKHPLQASADEQQHIFQSGFFYTADLVFDPEANTTGYNAASVLEDMRSEAGKLALGHQMAAHVALLQIVKDPSTGKSKISEIIMLDGQPRQNLCDENSGQSGLNAFRMQRLRNARPSQGQEPFPEPSLQQGQPFPEPSPQQFPMQQEFQNLMPLQQCPMPMRPIQQIPPQALSMQQMLSQPFQTHMQQLPMHSSLQHPSLQQPHLQPSPF